MKLIKTLKQLVVKFRVLVSKNKKKFTAIVGTILGLIIATPVTIHIENEKPTTGVHSNAKH